MTDDTRGDFFTSEAQKFTVLCEQLKKSVYTDTEESKKELNTLLEELISIEYSLRLADEQVTGTIITQCCYLVPLKHDVLVTKVCHLTANLLSKQQMVLSHGAEVITEYLIEALQRCQGWTFADILRALGVVVYENVGRLAKFHGSLLGPNGYLLQLSQAKEEDIVRGAMQCVENIAIKVPSQTYLSDDHWRACFHVLLTALQSPKPAIWDHIIHARILISGLRGLNCILLATKTLDPEKLGPLLAALKVYMLYGLSGMPTTVPPALVPIPLNKYDPSKAGGPGKPAPTPSQGDKAAGSDGPGKAAEGGSDPKQAAKHTGKKPKRKRGKGKKAEPKDEADDSETKSTQDAMGRLSLDPSQNAAAAEPSDTAAIFNLRGNKQSSSESEFSDTEGGQSSKLRGLHCKVRQCALGCFHAVIKAIEKRSMFSYWPAFIPDTPGVSGPTLFTTVMKDPSPKVRTAALAVLTALVDHSKQFLMAAEEADQYRSAPFTPFSVNLGHMVKEIHRCLLLALVSETSPLATTQIIKCLATLIPNVPYQRLKPGLLSRVVKQIRPYISHRDPNIRVACLTLLGSLSGVQAPLVEVLHILQAPQPPVRVSETSGLPQRFSDPLRGTSTDGETRTTETRTSESERQTAATDSGYSGDTPTSSPGLPTPKLASGAQTPSLSDSVVYAGSVELSWLVKLCIRNVAPHVLDTRGREQGNHATQGPTPQSPSQGRFVPSVPPPGSTPQGPPLGPPLQPLPVRLESLQTLSVLAKNYFPLLRSCLFVIRDTVFYCVADSDPVMQLHGAKLLEETAAVILQQYHDNADNRPDIDLMTQFWLPLLSGPLPSALQTVQYHAVKSTVCDCLSNIGHAIFIKMPLDKRILCVTLMLGLCSDEDHHVRAAAVRALGVYVLYPCLREDVSFVSDAGLCIITSLSEQNLGVRVKAAWALGNISDALVLNSVDADDTFVADFPDSLLLKLFEVAIQASQDNDKVKSNAVRALGNLLRYLPKTSMETSWCSRTVEAAILALVKNVTTGAMKVRWNACYAVGNLYKNGLLPLGEAKWSTSITTALCAVIRDCKNFKVRINASLAVSVPGARRHYGDTGQFSEVWRALVAALDNAETVTDFSEYRYRDSLTEQVISSLVHLSSLLDVSDLSALSALLCTKKDVIVVYTDKYKDLVRSKEEYRDKGPAIVSARQHIETMSVTPGISDEAGKAANVLLELLSLEREEIVYDESTITSPPHPTKSGFVQTYD